MSWRETLRLLAESDEAIMRFRRDVIRHNFNKMEAAMAEGSDVQPVDGNELDPAQNEEVVSGEELDEDEEEGDEDDDEDESNNAGFRDDEWEEDEDDED